MLNNFGFLNSGLIQFNFKTADIPWGHLCRHCARAWGYRNQVLGQSVQHGEGWDRGADPTQAQHSVGGALPAVCTTPGRGRAWHWAGSWRMSGLGTGNGSERELEGQVAGIFQAVWNSKSTTFQDGKLWAMSLECQCLQRLCWGVWNLFVSL